MLQFFRSFTKSKVGAILALVVLALVALAFASGDVASSGGFGGIAGGDRVATVGDQRIDSAALSQGATSALEGLKRQNPQMSMQAFLAGGGLDRVLEEMIGRTAVAGFGKEHGIVASDRLIDSEIAKIPSFMGPDGKFSEATFRQFLSQSGISEKMLRDDLAQGLVARQILGPASFGAVVPAEFATRYATLLKETRSGSIALLPSAAFVSATPPTAQQVTEFYNAHKDRFIRPERRVIRYATFGEAALKNVPAPTEAEIAARYNADKAQYAAQELRRLTQLIVPTEAAARAVIAEVTGGKSLEAAAGAKGLSAAKLGPIAKLALAGQTSQAVADASFAVASGALAAPARSGLGWHVIRVDGIDRRPERTLEQARGEIAAALAVQKRRAALNDFSARIEEEFENGGNLADAAKQLGIEVQQTPAITADGRIYGKPAETAPPILARALQTAFAMEEENKPQLAEVEPGKTFLIFDVTDIAPSAAAPLAEIRDDVTGAYLTDQGFKAAKAAAEQVLAATRKGTDLPAALAALRKPLPPVQKIDMGREQLAQSRGQVPPPLALLFSMAEGTVKTLAAPREQGWYVVALKDIAPGQVAPNDPLLANARRELGGLAGQEYAEQMRRAIRSEVGVKRNDKAIAAVRRQLTGGS